MAKSERRPRKPAAPKVPADIKMAAEAAADKKATDLMILDLRGSSAFTDFFVICTAGNVRQAQAIADGITIALKEQDVQPALTEGYDRGQWILIDYFDFIVHIFSPSAREYYGLERLWGEAKKIEITSFARTSSPT